MLRESESGENEDPFGHSVSVSGGGGPMQSLRSPAAVTTPSSSSSFSGGGPSLTPHGQPASTSHKASKSKKSKGNSKPFNLEKEKPQLLQTIASSSVASTNLLNSLKLINRERKRVSEDPEAAQRFEACKQLRRQVLRYIQHVESEQWLGSLIHANETLVEALMAFELLDKDLEDDSDSAAAVARSEDDDDDDEEFNEWDSDEAAEAKTKKGKGSVQQGFAGLSLGERKPPPEVIVNGRRKDGDSESEVDEDDDEDDPFGDINAVHTPKEERPGMNW